MDIKGLKELIKDLPDDMEIYLDTNDKYLDGNNKWDFIVNLPAPKFKMVGKLNLSYAVAQRACEETKDCKKCLIL